MRFHQNIRFWLASFITILSCFLGASPYIPKYLWSLGFATAADHSPFVDEPLKDYGTDNWTRLIDPKKYIHDVKDHEIIWVERSFLSRFYHTVLPKIQSPFILIINGGDISFPLDIYDEFKTKNLIEDPRVIAIFAQNVDSSYVHPKIHYLPIGLDFHSMTQKNGSWKEEQCSPREQEVILEEIMSSLPPTYQREKRVILDFGLNDFAAHGESRTQIISRLSSLPFVDQIGFLPRHLLWFIKGDYAFAVSPHGYGLDCHRTWEGLLLGNIVIVKTSSLDPMYEGLPVVIVQDWSEINEKNLDIWFEKYKDAFTNPSYREKLTHNYWFNKIKIISDNRI